MFDRRGWYQQIRRNVRDQEPITRVGWLVRAGIVLSLMAGWSINSGALGRGWAVIVGFV